MVFFDAKLFKPNYFRKKWSIFDVACFSLPYLTVRDSSWKSLIITLSSHCSFYIYLFRVHKPQSPQKIPTPPQGKIEL